MHQKATPPKQVPSPLANQAKVSEPHSAADKPTEAGPYAKVRKLMEANHVDEALTLARTRHDGPMKNAQGVCLMRKGLPEEAVRIYRTLVLDNTGLFMKENLPTIYKTNYALALMLSGNASGGLNILKELAGDNHESVQKLQAVANAWKAKLSFGQKIGLWLGLNPKRPVSLDFPPGDLM